MTVPAPAVRHPGLAELAMAVGGFGIGTGEFVIMGLLPQVAEGVGVGETQAGHAIASYALGVVVGAPAIAVLAARWSRQRVLVGLMALFALGNFASAAAGGYASLVLFRFLAGLPHGAYFGIASLVAASLAGPGERGRAVGRMMLGLTLATLLGVPLASWLGQALGWRWAFVFVALVGTLACLLIPAWVPYRGGDPQARPLRELAALRTPQVLLTLLIGATGFGGMFAVFSYIAPTLTHVSGLRDSQVPWAMAAFGAGMILGNLAGARLADRGVMRALALVLGWNIAVLALFHLLAPHLAGALAGTVLVGTSSALIAVLQIRLMDVAGQAQTLAAALNHSALNIANALGAWLGGVAIDAGAGWRATAWVGVGLGLAGLLVYLVSLGLQCRRPASAGATAP